MRSEKHTACGAFPRRIVCLTAETTETLYLLGEQHRIAGISGFTVRPPQARKEKPKVAAFTSAKLDRILELNPDLVLGFSNLQADIAAGLIRHGLQVHVFNQRTVGGILEMIQTLGALVGAHEKVAALIEHLTAGIEAVKRSVAMLPRRPRIYFEEWNDPLISGIGWVSELIGIAGGPGAPALSMARQDFPVPLAPFGHGALICLRLRLRQAATALRSSVALYGARHARPQWLHASRGSAIADYAPSLRSPWRAAVDCFAELACAPDARERTIHDPQEVVRHRPDIIIGSWCGKKFQPKQVAQRPGWAEIPAVRHGHVYEIKSADILQPGPAALDDGLRQLHEIIARWAASPPHE